MKTTLITATHKPYFIPADSIYFPVQAGAALHEKLEYTGDDSGENISAKNKNYCELTCLFWAWKNLDSDYIGLVHYRRHFAGKFSFDKKERILTGTQLASLLEKSPLILPENRNYFIESNYSQYVHAHHEEDLVVTKAIIAEKYPEYLPAFETVMKRTYGSRFNMFIMRRDLLNDYCTWLFDILFEVEKRLDISNYSNYDARVFGFISERLLDVWVIKNQYQPLRLPVVNLENQNFIRKATRFLLRKLTGGKSGKGV